MKIVIQRVHSAAVWVKNERISHIDQGLLLFVGIETHDATAILDKWASRIPRLRIFADETGKMSKSVTDVGGSVLAVSQFTLCANFEGGLRPSLNKAMEPQSAVSLFDYFTQQIQKSCCVQKGEFGANMRVEIENDGPVTFWIDAK